MRMRSTATSFGTVTLSRLLPVASQTSRLMSPTGKLLTTDLLTIRGGQRERVEVERRRIDDVVRRREAQSNRLSRVVAGERLVDLRPCRFRREVRYRQNILEWSAVGLEER